MFVQAVSIRNSRSLASVDMARCSSTNVLIGKNNSGKSNILSAISNAIGHLKTGNIVNPFPALVGPEEEFYQRKVEKTIQIGLQLAIDEEKKIAIANFISEESTGVDVALQSAVKEESFTVIIGIKMVEGQLSSYIKELGFGTMNKCASITSNGHKIIQVDDDVATDMIAAARASETIKSEISAIDKMLIGAANSPIFNEGRDRELTKYYTRQTLENLPGNMRRRVESIFSSSNNFNEFSDQVKAIRNDYSARLSEVSTNPHRPFKVFGGTVRVVPAYLPPILSMFSEIGLLHFRETREPIGADEAAQLLRLKTTRGGPKQLQSLQETIKTLLDVSVDAFEAEGVPRTLRQARSASRRAEMDIDEFLVEVNGAGIREALRIILDMELKKPEFILIEEPEVHLHPGMEKLLHSYLVTRGSSMQIFVATHSTNFLDVSYSQDVYIVSRDKTVGTTVEKAVSEEDILKIPEELGLKPSTLFMFNKLLFVEGPSDEDVIVTLARKLDIDISRRTVGFVRMGGASNTQNYASEATIQLLAKRAIPMLFIVDSDERSREAISKLQGRLGPNAKYHFLARRELENYLLRAPAVVKLILDKQKTTKGLPVPNIVDVEAAMDRHARSLKQRVVELRIGQDLLTPIFPGRQSGCDALEKMRAALDQLQIRCDTLSDKIKKVDEDVGTDWDLQYMNRAPGSEVLDLTLKDYGLAYHRDRDAARLAEYLDEESIDPEIENVLREFGRT